MGNDLFLLFDYWDDNVYRLNKGKETTIVKDYADAVKGLFIDSRNCYCSEGKDISESDNGSIEVILSEKIARTSVTIVLISPGMIRNEDEKEQRIPWEISYSLKNGQHSDGHASAILAVILPDRKRRYDYAIHSRRRKTFVRKEAFFSILYRNMFNRKDSEYEKDQHGNAKYTPKNSYVVLARWNDFCINPDFYLNLALSNRSDREQFTITEDIE